MTDNSKHLVHSDCDYTPLDPSGKCPECDIYPDMQSKEFRSGPAPDTRQKIQERLDRGVTEFGPIPQEIRDEVALLPRPVEKELEWAWVSPSAYWKITRVQPAHQTGKRPYGTFSLLLIEFTHRKENGDRIVVESYVGQRNELLRLRGFLDAAVEIPDGIRLSIHTVRKAPWDDVTPRYRP